MALIITPTRYLFQSPRRCNANFGIGTRSQQLEAPIEPNLVESSRATSPVTGEQAPPEESNTQSIPITDDNGGPAAYAATIAQARATYTAKNPPFTTTRQKELSLPSVYLLGNDGSLPENYLEKPAMPTSVRSWNDHYVFRTVDINDRERWIICFVRGGKKATYWKRWVDIEKGFEPGPCLVALSKPLNQNSRPLATSHLSSLREASPELPHSSPTTRVDSGLPPPPLNRGHDRLAKGQRRYDNEELSSEKRRKNNPVPAPQSHPRLRFRGPKSPLSTTNASQPSKNNDPRSNQLAAIAQRGTAARKENLSPRVPSSGIFGELLQNILATSAAPQTPASTSRSASPAQNPNHQNQRQLEQQYLEQTMGAPTEEDDSIEEPTPQRTSLSERIANFDRSRNRTSSITAAASNQDAAPIAEDQQRAALLVLSFCPFDSRHADTSFSNAARTGSVASKKRNAY